MKKTIKSTISIILALCMLLASLAACEKEETNNDDPVEENAVPINWCLIIEDPIGTDIVERGTEMPENFFDYWYAELPEYKDRWLDITLCFDYEHTFEDMPEDFQQAYMEFYEEYDGNFADESGKVVKRAKLENLKKSAKNIALDTANKYYASLDFESSIEPKVFYTLKWDEDKEFEYYTGYIYFRFHNSCTPHLDKDHNYELFDAWEWHERINELAKIPGLKSVYVSLTEWI
ncbi:MAG: hypothetical protein E7633_07475 [Ruminococcaceae bacterium]|nr:hypothetical protein [Oscillospiraceae bacterium]